MADNIDRCPICAEPFKADDICATDITEGTCHAACLEGSPVVDLDTGDELPGGKIDTYSYSEVMDPSPAPTQLHSGGVNAEQAESEDQHSNTKDQRNHDFHEDTLQLVSSAQSHDHPNVPAPAPVPKTTGATYSQAECDELCEIAKRDGYEEAVQDIDQKTGGDGEYRYCLGMEDDIRHQPDAATMIQRIVDRFEVLNLLDDASKTGSDQPDDETPEPHLRGSFQSRVQPWMMACFGEMIAGDREERNHRFLEEALELVQSTGCTESEAHQLVDYVYGRAVGEPHQEVGGVMVTLAALCLANTLDMHEAAETELARIWTKVDAIRAKQAAKPKHSPLPGPSLAAEGPTDAV